MKDINYIDMIGDSKWWKSYSFIMYDCRVEHRLGGYTEVIYPGDFYSLAVL